MIAGDYFPLPTCKVYVFTKIKAEGIPDLLLVYFIASIDYDYRYYYE